MRGLEPKPLGRPRKPLPYEVEVVGLDDVPTDHPAPDDDTELLGMRLDFERLLDSCVRNQREKDIMRARLGGASMAEIAEAHGIGPKRVYQLVAHVTRMMQRRVNRPITETAAERRRAEAHKQAALRKMLADRAARAAINAQARRDREWLGSLKHCIHGFCGSSPLDVVPPNGEAWTHWAYQHPRDALTDYIGRHPFYASGHSDSFHPAEPDVGIFGEQIEVTGVSYFVDGAVFHDEDLFVDAVYALLSEEIEDTREAVAKVVRDQVDAWEGELGND